MRQLVRRIPEIRHDYVAAQPLPTSTPSPVAHPLLQSSRGDTLSISRFACKINNTFCTTGFDARFPNQNQTKHCWQNYVDYHKCVLAKGEDFKPCRQVSATLRPSCYVPLHADTAAASSSWPTGRCAPAPGVSDGMTREASLLSIGYVRTRLTPVE